MLPYQFVGQVSRWAGEQPLPSFEMNRPVGSSRNSALAGKTNSYPPDSPVALLWGEAIFSESEEIPVARAKVVTYSHNLSNPTQEERGAWGGKACPPKIEMKKNISRRDFIKIGAGALLSANLLRSSNIFSEEEKPDLAVVKSENSADAVKQALEALGGIRKFVKPKQTVILKPNMSFPNPAQWATTTNPQVVAAVASLCVNAGAKRVLIIDHPMRQPEKCLSRTGIEAACKDIKGVYVRTESEQRDYKEVLLNKKAERFAKVFENRTPLLQKVEISKKAQSKGILLINLPVAKSHSATGVSFGMKNLMGLIWDRTHFHRVDIHRAIAELTAIIRPNLTIVDATQVLLTRGPEGPGQTKQLNTIIAGIDPVAVDTYATTLERWNGQKLEPKDVGYIDAAHELKLGEIDLNKVNIKEV